MAGYHNDLPDVTKDFSRPLLQHLPIFYLKYDPLARVFRQKLGYSVN